MAAKKVDALEERLEGEMNQIKTTVEERMSSMEGQVADLRDMIKKMVTCELKYSFGLLANSSISYQDHKGRFLLAFGFNCVHWDSGYLELLAFRSLRRVIKEWMFEAKGIIIEGDNANVIKYLQESFIKVVHPEANDVLEDFSFLMGFDSVLFNHVKRGCNKLADCCANFALKGDFVWDDLCGNKVPPFFFSLLKEDGDSITIT
ncbi:hypothetical protein M5K25_017892 [Dendrobium thyrsiflorum]|uniref:RNase H type-1 domain-containing protein n=1 Tax=Dendrobium thyrsiflorum TaxID=117978 RepID=A0ABD0UP41_DENTH